MRLVNFNYFGGHHRGLEVDVNGLVRREVAHRQSNLGDNEIIAVVQIR